MERYRLVRYNLLSFKLAVGISQPAERQLVLTGHAMVEVDQCVITLHIRIQRLLQVPAMPQLVSDSDILARSVLFQHFHHHMLELYTILIFIYSPI